MSGGNTPAPAASTTLVQPGYSPAEQAARDAIQAKAGDLFNSTANLTAGGYPGAAPVPFSSNTVAGQNQLLGFANGAGANAASAGANALKFGLSDVLYPQTNPALQQTIDTATRKVGEAYTDPGGVLSGIRTNFTGGNSNGSGTREGIANGLAARSYLNTVGDVTGQIASKGYDSGLNAFSQTLNSLPATMSAMTQPALATAAVGQQQEGQAQAVANYGADKNLWNINAPWQNLQNYSNVVYGGSSPSTTTTGVSTTGGANPTAGVGTALAGSALAAQLGLSPILGAAASLLLSYL